MNAPVAVPVRPATPGAPPPAGPAVAPAWRRLLFFGPVLGVAAGGTALMARVLGTNGLGAAEAAALAVFAVSFGWIALSSWAAVLGFALRLARRHPVTLQREAEAPAARPAAPLPPLRTRVALIMPVHNEDPRRVFAGVAATWRSLAATGRLTSFDLFVLSDTTDPDTRVAEEALWRDACRALGADGRLFYRHRADNRGRKAGNVADWVRRWGGAYEGFVVLDADSVMAGEALVRLAKALEADPGLGAVQAPTVAVNRRTLFARALQFAARLHGPLPAAGHAFWQLGDANYFGHNAILRTRAFAACCGLPELPGAPPLGGELLSHDFVEAALLRRAGWRVLALPELAGSYEEVPANLPDHAARDRRWAQGNLQHARVLLRARGLHWSSRLHLLLGVLAFVASPLWLLLLVLSSALVVEQAAAGHAYFPPGARSLFPVWPEHRPAEAHAVLAATAVLLFLPKALGVALVLARGEERRAFGGAARLLAGAAAELLLSVLLAPVTMLLHSGFVLGVLAGRSVGWGAQPRDDRGVGWREALRRHAGHGVLGAAWGGLLLWLAPGFAGWMAPVLAGMLLAAPLAVLTSRAAAGEAARRLGLFLTPEEVAPPPELRTLRAELARLAGRPLPGLADLLSDPHLRALHLAQLDRGGPADAALLALAGRAAEDPASLGPAERRRVLGSAAALEHAARLLAEAPARRAAPREAMVALEGPSDPDPAVQWSDGPPDPHPSSGSRAAVLEIPPVVLPPPSPLAMPEQRL